MRYTILLVSNSNFTSLAFLVVFDDFVIMSQLINSCILTACVLNVASIFGGDLGSSS